MRHRLSNVVVKWQIRCNLVKICVNSVFVTMHLRCSCSPYPHISNVYSLYIELMWFSFMHSDFSALTNSPNLPFKRKFGPKRRSAPPYFVLFGVCLCWFLIEKLKKPSDWCYGFGGGVWLLSKSFRKWKSMAAGDAMKRKFARYMGAGVQRSTFIAINEMCPNTPYDI